MNNWPFKETPGEFAERMSAAYFFFGGDMLAAVRCVLIENPPAPQALGGEPSDEQILSMATRLFPRWEEDIQEKFVLQLVRAALAVGAPQAPAPAASIPADTVMVLLNHIEDVISDADWNLIDPDKWNAVTPCGNTARNDRLARA